MMARYHRSADDVSDRVTVVDRCSLVLRQRSIEQHTTPSVDGHGVMGDLADIDTNEDID